MSNEMKLLTALTKALGFDIEVIKPQASDYGWEFTGDRSAAPQSLTVDYKVTKNTTNFTKDTLNIKYNGFDYKGMLSRYLQYINGTYLSRQDEPEVLKVFTPAELQELKRMEHLVDHSIKQIE